MRPNFQIIRAQRSGHPVVIMVDASLEPVRDATTFPWLLTVRVPMRRRSPEGLCDQAEASRLNDVEDHLLGKLDDEESRFVGHVTGNGRREVLLYVREADTAIAKINQGLLGLEEASVEVLKSHDPNWDYYRQFPR